MEKKLVNLDHFNNLTKIIQRFGDREDLQTQLQWATEVANMLNEILHKTINAECLPPEAKEAIEEELLNNFLIATHIRAIEHGNSIEGLEL